MTDAKHDGAADLIAHAAELVKTSANLGGTGRSLSQLEAIAEAVAAERDRCAAALEDPSPEMVEDLATLLFNSAHAASSVFAQAHDICQHLGDYLRNEATRGDGTIRERQPRGPGRWSEPGQIAMAAEPSAEAMIAAAQWIGDGTQKKRLAVMFDAFAAEATAAERDRIARRVSEHQILHFQAGRDPLVEVNEFIQDLAHDIATDWEDYE